MLPTPMQPTNMRSLGATTPSLPRAELGMIAGKPMTPARERIASRLVHFLSGEIMMLPRFKTAVKTLRYREKDLETIISQYLGFSAV
jgi:hypothetical protein